MFTGIVETCVPVRTLECRGSGARLLLPAPDVPGWEAHVGQSIAVCGACLTVAEIGSHGELAFDLSSETLDRTWFGGLAAGTLVNVERALRLGDRLDGHMVSGHVDGQATLVAIEPTGDGGSRFSFEVDSGLERYLFDKGSVTLDGISLTVVAPRGRTFDVALIPVTLAVTHLARATVGRRVNVEVDLVGKWIERLLPARP